MEHFKKLIRKELNGKKFNEIIKKHNLELVKLTNYKEIHNGFQFQDGENKNNEEFIASGKCKNGGIYFILKEEIQLWLKYGNNIMHWYRNVIIPNDARVFIEDNKFKADIIILDSRNNIDIVKYTWNYFTYDWNVALASACHTSDIKWINLAITNGANNFCIALEVLCSKNDIQLATMLIPYAIKHLSLDNMNRLLIFSKYNENKQFIELFVSSFKKLIMKVETMLNK